MNSKSWKNYLGVLSGCSDNMMKKDPSDSTCGELNLLFDDVAYAHPWFIREHIDYAFQMLIKSLGNEKINSPSILPLNNKILAFWLRPLSPFEGIELIISAMRAGFRCVLNVNETEKPLYKGMLKMLQRSFKEMEGRIEYTDKPLSDADAWVIVGESPTPLQLTYFKKKPLFMDASNEVSSVAVIYGDESNEELELLTTDLCMYFGRSRYNTVELLVPEEYDFAKLLKSIEKYANNANHSRYFNHYEYCKAAFMVSGEAFIDNGFLLFIKGMQHARYIGVVQYSEYKSSGLHKINLKGKQVFKAKANREEGELEFGKALGPRCFSVGQFLVFLSEV